MLVDVCQAKSQSEPHSKTVTTRRFLVKIRVSVTSQDSMAPKDVLNHLFLLDVYCARDTPPDLPQLCLCASKASSCHHSGLTR